MTREETFVLIAGGGPIGLTAAIALGRRGVPAILVNERLETATHPKCNNTNARSMEHYRRLGVAEDIHAASLHGQGQEGRRNAGLPALARDAAVHPADAARANSEGPRRKAAERERAF